MRAAKPITFPISVTVSPASGLTANNKTKYGTDFSAFVQVQSRQFEVAVGGEIGRNRIDGTVFVFKPAFTDGEVLDQTHTGQSLPVDSLITYGGRKHKVLRLQPDRDQGSGRIYRVLAYCTDAGASA